MNPIKAIKTEISDTIALFKDLYTITKNEGLSKALVFDAVCTALRHPSVSEYMGLLKVNPKIQHLPGKTCLNITTGETYDETPIVDRSGRVIGYQKTNIRTPIPSVDGIEYKF